ncbi:MAG: redox-sensing transcriptional repressor Rex [candidate division Zixibacteria bacterium]|nr:redox-sensing transcriptional repressor Rex [Candidatus Tariuqbacter arcticus]
MPKISYATVRRLSRYYRSLDLAERRHISTVSSEELARQNHLTAAQVRKDLSFFGAFGRRGLGYNVSDLKRNISRILGIDRTWNVAVIGAGNIGRALINFEQFKIQGFLIRLVLDNDSMKIGKKVGDLVVKDMKGLPEVVKKIDIDIAIICVPSNAAQKVVDMLVVKEVGIKAILNFAPVSLSVPKGVTVRNENMAIEIEALSFALTNPDYVR